MPPPVGTLANPAQGGIGPYAKAFRSLVAYLQSHPSCSGIRSWRSWTGRNDDDVVPSADQCPWVRLTPMGMPAAYRAFGQPIIGQSSSFRDVMSPLKIGIETAVTDSNFDASAAVWDALSQALFPTDDAGAAKLRAALEAAGVTDMTLVQPALPTGLASYGDRMIVADGAIQLDIVIEV